MPLQEALEWWSRQDDMGGFRAVAQVLFPGWKPKRSCRAPHREDNAASFSVYKNERGTWRFKDFAGEQGGLVGFVMLAGMDQKAASHWLMDKAGNVAGQSMAFAPAGKAAKGKESKVEKLPAMPEEAMAAWIEGVHYLQARPGLVERLANWRGWPVEFPRYVVDCAVISMPLYHGERTIAFPVTVPEAGTTCLGGHIIMRDVGFHCRLKPRDGQRRASWRFVPNEKEHKQSTPALPYIIGGSDFDSASLLVITEGQWDAMTFALAAGWLGDGCPWPENVCVIGIRGTSGVNSFLQTYDCFWPEATNCLLLPDTDSPGSKWFDNGDSFADRLAERCRKVAVVGCGAHKDFNDLYRAEKVRPEQIAQLLASHGMSLEREVTA
jgi:hypothetical protein